jgi:hypothetical protein
MSGKRFEQILDQDVINLGDLSEIDTFDSMSQHPTVFALSRV